MWHLSFPCRPGRRDSVPGFMCWAQGSLLIHTSPSCISHSLPQRGGQIPDKKNSFLDFPAMSTSLSVLIKQDLHSDASAFLWTPHFHFWSPEIPSSNSEALALFPKQAGPTWNIRRAVPALTTCYALFRYKRKEHILVPSRPKLIYSVT